MNNVFFVIAETRFTGDENKNLSNQLKHEGISFELALRVFRDPLRLTRLDRIEDHEERWQTIGVVHGVTLLLVTHAIIEEDKDGQALGDHWDHLGPKGQQVGKEPL